MRWSSGGVDQLKWIGFEISTFFFPNSSSRRRERREAEVDREDNFFLKINIVIKANFKVGSLEKKKKERKKKVRPFRTPVL